MRSAGENVAWLEALSPWPEEFGLGRMRELLRRLGNPERGLPGDPRRRHEREDDDGARGRGAAARRGRAPPASYTSPHVVSWGERIRVGGEEADLEAALARVRAEAEAVGATQFEALTAAALAEFAAAEVDVAVVEAGLGGRHDATNVLDARVVVLTNVAPRAHGRPRRHTRGDRGGEARGRPARRARRARRAGVGAGRARRRGRRRHRRRRLRRRAGARGRRVVPRPHGRPGAARRGGRPGPARARGRGAARDLGRRAQPRRRRLPAHARPARGLGGRRLDPGRQGRGRDAGGALGARRPPRGDVVVEPARAARGRLWPALARPFFGHVEAVPEPAAALARGRELAGEDGALLVTGSLYLLADLASVRPSCLPWQASASG